MPLPLALSVRGSVRVLVIYRISHTNFSQSSPSVSQTLIVKKYIDVQVSGRARLVA